MTWSAHVLNKAAFKALHGKQKPLSMEQRLSHNSDFIVDKRN
jgi:hypothetical protein